MWTIGVGATVATWRFLMDPQDATMPAMTDIDSIILAEWVWFQGWQPRYQPPDVPPPASAASAWVYEESTADGFEDYAKAWRERLLESTLEVFKNEGDLAKMEL